MPGTFTYVRGLIYSRFGIAPVGVVFRQTSFEQSEAVLVHLWTQANRHHEQSPDMRTHPPLWRSGTSNGFESPTNIVEST